MKLAWYFLVAAVCLCGWVSVAQAQQRGDRPSAELARAELARADRLLREGDFEAAAAAYEQLNTDALPAASVYNHGIALYRAGNMTAAAERFQRAAAAADDSLAAKARFNLGNSHYARGLAAVGSQEQPDPAAAIGQLALAIDSYRSSLRIDPTDADARANIELAAKLIKQLQQQQQQEQEQQQQPSQQQDPADKSDHPEQQDQDSESEDGQQNEPQPSKTTQSPSNRSNASQPDQQQPEQQQQSEQQQSEQQQSEQQQQTNPQGDGQQESNTEAGADRSKMPSRPRENQSRPPSQQHSADAQDQAESPDQDDTHEQETPAGELTAANQSNEDAGQDPSQMVIPSEAMRMTDQEARKMLQSIRDRDMLRRLRRQAAERARRIPVDRDW